MYAILRTAIGLQFDAFDKCPAFARIVQCNQHIIVYMWGKHWCKTSLQFYNSKTSPSESALLMAASSAKQLEVHSIQRGSPACQNRCCHRNCTPQPENASQQLYKKFTWSFSFMLCLDARDGCEVSARNSFRMLTVFFFRFSRICFLKCLQ